MPQGSSAVRPTNGLYLYLYRSLEQLARKVEMHQFQYFDCSVEELAVLVDRFVNEEISEVGLCIDGINCYVLVIG